MLTPKFTARFPRELSARITVRTKDVARSWWWSISATKAGWNFKSRSTEEVPLAAENRRGGNLVVEEVVIGSIKVRFAAQDVFVRTVEFSVLEQNNAFLQQLRVPGTVAWTLTGCSDDMSSFLIPTLGDKWIAAGATQVEA